MRDPIQTRTVRWPRLLARSLLTGAAGCAGLETPPQTTKSLPPPSHRAVSQFSTDASRPLAGNTARGRFEQHGGSLVSEPAALETGSPSDSSKAPGWKATRVIQQVAHQEPSLLGPNLDAPPWHRDRQVASRLPEPAEPGAVRQPATDAHDVPQPNLPTSANTPNDLPSHQLDLSTALQLIAGQSPAVAFAHQRIVEADARRDGASALWLPSIRAGVSYHRHDGNLQASNGSLADVNRSSLQAGLGAGAIGAGTTPVPGVVAQFHLSDAFFQPQIAERTVEARKFGSWVTYHDELLRAAETYFDLLRAWQARAIAEETVANSDELLRLTTAFANSGQGPQADADRAATEQALRRNELTSADESVEVASARLVEVLHLDAPLHIVPVEVLIIPINLVSTSESAQSLVATGLSGRPELGESHQLVEAACEQLQREEFAPLMPSVLLGMSYGGFGGGMGRSVNNVDDRLDVDLSAVWELRNFGAGDAAAKKAARARVDQARYQEIQLMDRVAREIVVAHAQVRHRQQQIDTATVAVSTARQAFERDRQRINEGQGLPLEALQSLSALDRARREYLRTVIDFNVAQFRLHHALGWPQ